MKRYYVKIEHPEGKLRTRDKLVLECIEKFDTCLINDTQVKASLAYFETLINDSLKSKPRAKKVNLPYWSSVEDKEYMTWIGEIGIRLKEIKDMPADFDEFDNKWAFPWTNKITIEENKYEDRVGCFFISESDKR